MKVKHNSPTVVEIELSQRNVDNLIAAVQRGEYALLTRRDLSSDVLLRVRLVPDSEHYTDREPGRMPLDNVEVSNV